MLGPANRLGKAEGGGDRLDQRRGHERLLLLAQQARKRNRQRRTETRRQHRARQRGKVADASQTRAAERPGGILFQLQRRHGQLFDLAYALPRQRPRGVRRIGKPRARGQTPRRQLRRNRFGQSSLALEQMDTARNIENEALRRVCRHRWGIIAGKAHQALQQGRIRRRIMGKHGKRGHPRARIGERKAGAKADPGGAPRHSGKTKRAALLFDKHERPVRRRDPAPRCVLARQPGQVDRQIAAALRPLRAVR